MNKTDKRTIKLHKQRYGHFGAGASHTREASEAEVIRHIQKIKKNKKKKFLILIHLFLDLTRAASNSVPRISAIIGT